MKLKTIRKKFGLTRKMDEEKVKEHLPSAHEVKEEITKKIKKQVKYYNELKRDPNHKMIRQRRYVKKHGISTLTPNDVPNNSELKEVPTLVSRTELQKAINLLENHEVVKKTKSRKTQEDIIKESCKKRLIIEICENEAWDTATEIIRHIKYCVSINDWENLTSLLLLLLNHKPHYLPYIKEMTFLNVLMNPHDRYSECFDAFMQQMFTPVEENKKTDDDKKSRNKEDFDISFIDD